MFKTNKNKNHAGKAAMLESLEAREMFASDYLVAPPPSSGVLIGLLLPAVQKVRETAVTSSSLCPSDPVKPTQSLKIDIMSAAVKAEPPPAP